MARDVDVVIVGAGAAGLSAAKAAAARGLAFVLVEASHRIGGRALTEDLARGQPFDLGCHWMHSASINPLVPIADEYGFRYRRDGEGWHGAIHHHGAFASSEQLRDLERAARVQHAAVEAAGKTGDPAVADVVDLDGPWAPWLAYWFSVETSCDWDRTGAASTLAYNDTGENWPVIEGYGALIAAWGADVPVTLNAAVERIRMTRDGVEVETARGPVRGRTALVTVSTGMLSSGRIAFEPELPAWKLAAAHALPLGVHNRIGVLLDGPEGDGSPSCSATVMTEDDEVPMHVEVSPYGHSYAVGVTGGRFASWLERAGQAAAVECLVEHLRAVCGSAITNRITGRAIATAWEGDAWTLGSYSAAMPGQVHQRAELARPVDERIFFAGEATSPEFFSTCHGAYLSGRCALDEIAGVLGRGA